MLNGSKIDSYIRREKITQLTLAERANLSKPTISKMVNHNKCDLQSLIAVANVMGVSLDYLCDRDKHIETKVNYSESKSDDVLIYKKLVLTQEELIKSKEKEIDSLKKKVEYLKNEIQSFKGYAIASESQPKLK